MFINIRFAFVLRLLVHSVAVNISIFISHLYRFRRATTHRLFSILVRINALTCIDQRLHTISHTKPSKNILNKLRNLYLFTILCCCTQSACLQRVIFMQRSGMDKTCIYLSQLFVAKYSKNNLKFKRYALLRRSVFCSPKRKIQFSFAERHAKENTPNIVYSYF